jgi:hypothetical protein
MNKTTARKATKKAPKANPEDAYIELLSRPVTPEDMIEKLHESIDGIPENERDEFWHLLDIKRTRATIEFVRQHSRRGGK